MEHLSCFFPGTLALSATGGKRASEINMTPRQLRDLDLAEEITRSCYETYKRVRTGLGPERVYWSSLPSQAGDTEGRAALKVLKDHQSPIGGSSTPASYETYEGTHSRHPDVSTLFDGTDSTKLDFDIQDSRNMLRPETIESLFILYRITGKQEYRDMGWEIFQAFERWTKVTTGGYTELVSLCGSVTAKNS